jgi:hypothetical protein
MFFKKQEECEKNYKLGRTLGTGSFATVRAMAEWAVQVQHCNGMECNAMCIYVTYTTTYTTIYVYYNVHYNVY